MDTGALAQFEKIVSREMMTINATVAREVDGVLRAITILSEDVKELEGRMRMLEISNTNVITELRTDVSYLKLNQHKIEGDINALGQKQADWIKYVKAIEEEAISYSKELFVEQSLFDKYKLDVEIAFNVYKLEVQKTTDDLKLEAEKKAGDQKAINVRNELLRAGLWTGVVIIMSGLFGLVFNLVTHGGLAGLAKAWGLIP